MRGRASLPIYCDKCRNAMIEIPLPGIADGEFVDVEVEIDAVLKDNEWHEYFDQDNSKVIAHCPNCRSKENE